MLISLGEYAKMKGKDSGNLRTKIKKGHFKSAKKIGNQWVIDSNEEWIDKRRKVLKEITNERI